MNTAQQSKTLSLHIQTCASLLISLPLALGVDKIDRFRHFDSVAE